MRNGAPAQLGSEAAASSSAPAARGSLDERLWGYHDRYHCGPYALCGDCSSIWHWETVEGLPNYTGRRG